MQRATADKAEHWAILQRLFSGATASVKFVEKEEDLAGVLSKLLQPDAAISPSGKDFGFVHRQTDDSDVYFVANTSNEKRQVQVEFRAKGTSVEVWDALNGAGAVANVTARTPTSVTVGLDFEPYQSHVVVFSKGKSALPKAPLSVEVISSLDLSSDWQVTFGTNSPASMKQLSSWTDAETTRYFSGTAIYQKNIDLPESGMRQSASIVLDFGDAKSLEALPQRNGMRTWIEPPIREAAVINVNGQRAGSLWCPPYRIDIKAFLKPGRNDIRIEVANTAVNFMAGRKLPDYKLLNLRYGERFQPQDMDKIQPVASGNAWPC